MASSRRRLAAGAAGARSAHFVEGAGLAQRIAVLGGVFLQPVVERLQADAERRRRLLLVAAEMLERRQRQQPLDLGERRADAHGHGRRGAAGDGRAGRRRQAVVVDGRAGGHHVGAIDDVAQLAHVARPAVRGEALEDVAAEPLRRALALADLGQEMTRDERDVLGRARAAAAGGSGTR